MEDAKGELFEEKSLSLALILYSSILLVAFAIGLYGLFSLLWMAGDALEQSTRALSLS
jgi:hypothetical protein